MKNTLVYLLVALTIFICWVLYESRPAKINWHTPPGADYSIGYNWKRRKWEMRPFNPVITA